MVKRTLVEEKETSIEVTVRRAGQLAADLNRQFRLDFPITKDELLILTADLLDEAAEDARARAVKTRRSSGIPGPAFTGSLAIGGMAGVTQ